VSGATAAAPATSAATGVAHAGVTDATGPLPYSVLVFRDPANIQLELMWTAAPE